MIDPLAPPERAHLKALWEAYFAATGLPVLTATFARRQDLAALHKLGVSPERLRAVIGWVRGQMALRNAKYSVNALDWRNLMARPETFEELLAKVPEPKAGRVKAAPVVAGPVLSEEERARIVAAAKATARELREKLSGGSPL